MKLVYSDLIQFRGSHYDFGRMQGESLKSSMILRNRKKQWASRRKHHFIIDENMFEKLIQRFAPGVWEELHGLADALQWPIKDAIREFGGYYLEYVHSGCSIFMGNHYMIRNYDNHPHSYEGRFVLFQPESGGYATIGPSMQITGRTDGMNEHGLSIGYNFINRRQSEDGFVCNMIGRMILERAATVDEAVDLLKEIPHRHSFSYVLIDRSGQSLVVEASPRKVISREGQYCTNHFQTLTEENRYRMDDSLRREKIIRQEKVHIDNAFDAFYMMNDSSRGIFSANYGAWAGTLHTALYDTRSLMVGYALGGDKQPLMINFDQWLKGTDSPIVKIKGSIPSSSAFLNMEVL